MSLMSVWVLLMGQWYHVHVCQFVWHWESLSFINTINHQYHAVTERLFKESLSCKILLQKKHKILIKSKTNEISSQELFFWLKKVWRSGSNICYNNTISSITKKTWITFIYEINYCIFSKILSLVFLKNGWRLNRITILFCQEKKD